MPTALDTEETRAIEFALNETDARPYKDYSGRAMYGDTCFGLTGTIAQFAQFLIALALEDQEHLARRFADTVRTDSMGLSTIFYFPGIATPNLPDYCYDNDDEEY